jgi:MFS transporter, PPP family, 3-phenylpropionic acid transporter
MKNKYLLHVLMFFYFTAGAVMFPYLTIYFSQTLMPLEIGILMAIIPAAMLFLQPFWGWAADKYGIRRILLLTLSFTMLSAIGFLFVKAFIGFFIVLTIYSIFVASISSLIDTMVLSLRNDKYGSIRLWGSIGYGTGAFFGGLFKSHLLGFWSFVIHICILVITLIIVLRIPINETIKNNMAIKLTSKNSKLS